MMHLPVIPSWLHPPYRAALLLLLGIALSACGARPNAPTATSLTVDSPPATAVATPTPAPTMTEPAAPSESAAPTSTTMMLTPTVDVPTGTLLFEGAEALAHANAQCDIGPRPAGSEALLQTRDYIERTLEANGWTVIRQDGEYLGVPIHNVVGVKGAGPARMVGAHYDTRPVADKDLANSMTPILGGNDGASGVAVLLELSRTLEIPEGRQVQLAFYDAEDRGNLDGWPFSVGAQQMATNLPVDRPEAVVVLDMIGDADLQIYRERNSTVELNDALFGIADALGFSENGFYNQEKYTIIDDHLPFLQQGIPAADLIDFDYPYWHTTEDTCDKLSAESLFKVGRVAEVWLEGD